MARVLSINLSSRIDSSSTSTSEYSSEENRHVKFKETPEIILDQQQEATNGKKKDSALKLFCLNIEHFR